MSRAARVRQGVQHSLLGALVALGCCIAAAEPISADTLVLRGSTTFHSTLIVPYWRDIEAIAGHTLQVIPSKSDLGLIALLDRQADLAMISSPLQSEVDLLRGTRPDLPFDRLHGFLVHRTRVAFAVHPVNPVRSASLTAMRRVLTGEIDNWTRLGGPDLPIEVVTPPEGGGVPLSIELQLLRGQRVAPRHSIVVEFGPELPQVVKQRTGALGLAQLGELQRHKLPELTLNPMVEQQLLLVSLGEPTPAMYAVIDAARRVATGQLD